MSLKGEEKPHQQRYGAPIGGSALLMRTLGHQGGTLLAVPKGVGPSGGGVRHGGDPKFPKRNSIGMARHGVGRPGGGEVCRTSIIDLRGVTIYLGTSMVR